MKKIYLLVGGLQDRRICFSTEVIWIRRTQPKGTHEGTIAALVHSRQIEIACEVPILERLGEVLGIDMVAISGTDGYGQIIVAVYQRMVLQYLQCMITVG